MLACAISLSAIRRCPLFGVSAIREFLKYGMYGKSSWYIAYCPLYGRCPLFGVSAKRGSTACILICKDDAFMIIDEQLTNLLLGGTRNYSLTSERGLYQ